MNPTPLYAFSVEPFRTWSAFAWKTAETMLASAQVIARRTDLLISTGNSPSASNQREFALMGQEKIVAASESAGARDSQRGRVNALTGILVLAFERTQHGS